MYSTSQDEVIFECINKRGVITLNKPKTLNAINTPMVIQILDKLKKWEDQMDMVIIRGGEKAFCAGGDIVAVTKAGPGRNDEGKNFFRTEYAMNNKIGTYSLPYVALIHGITMGGGFGLSVHGKYRIATEKTLFAMPETAIGLFPDVGGTYILPRLCGKLGLYLALTGQRLKGVDCVKAGIATHYVESKDLPALYDCLVNAEFKQGVDIERDLLQKFSQDINSYQFSLSPHLDKINKIFSLPKVEDMISQLKQDNDEWCTATYKTLQKMSPVSLKVSKKALEYGSLMNLQECLQMENRIASHILNGKVSTDFYEGINIYSLFLFWKYLLFL
jgi:3-hydroxyisobutyryl-CoA hydrolase